MRGREGRHRPKRGQGDDQGGGRSSGLPTPSSFRSRSCVLTMSLTNDLDVCPGGLPCRRRGKGWREGRWPPRSSQVGRGQGRQSQGAREAKGRKEVSSLTLRKTGRPLLPVPCSRIVSFFG